MPKRIPRSTIILHRDGVRTIPKIGTAFDFTKEEIAEIDAVNPDALGKNLVEVEEDDEADPDANKPAANKPAGKPVASGKPKATGAAEGL